MRRITEAAFAVCICSMLSCSSSDQASGSGGAGGTGGAEAGGGPAAGAAGTPDAANGSSESGPSDASVDATVERSASGCDIPECFRANECVRQCGGAVESSGCCACEAPPFDRLQCDGGK